MEKQVLDALGSLLTHNLDLIVSFLGGVLLWMAKRTIGKMDAAQEATQEDIEAIDKRLTRVEKRFIRLITEHRIRHKDSTINPDAEDHEEV